MAKFRKKPVVIEAHQWFKNGDHPEDASVLIGTKSEDDTSERFLSEGKVVRYFRHPDIPGKSICSECGKTFHVHGWIDTKEDGHRVCPADWIITGGEGERYPCKPGIFDKTYDPAPEGA